MSKEQQNAVMAFDDVAGDYYQGLDPQAFTMPFLALLQGLSPQCQRGNPAYVKDAAPGMILNTLTGKLYERLDVSVAKRTHSLCWWTPRDKGGGWLGEIELERPGTEAEQRFMALPLDEKKRRIDKDGNEWTEHRNFFCRIVAADNAREPVVVSQTKSQLKTARDWNSLIDLYSARVPARSPDGQVITGQDGRPLMRPALGSEIWTLSSKLRTKGENSWFMWTVAHKGRHNNVVVLDDVKAAIAAAKEMK